MSAIELLRSLVAFDTTSRNSNLALVEWVADRLEDAGARIRLTHDDTGQKANLVASFGPDEPGGTVLSAHTDVVPVDGQVWSSDPFELTEVDGRLHGRGTADMKGFVAACLAAAPAWGRENLRRPVHVALSYDEEAGCLGVPRLVDDLVKHVPQPGCAIVGEPTGMRIADRHRGYLGFRTTFHGHAVHSSDPARGVSAISAAARFVNSVEHLAAEQADGNGRTTVSVGQISGGTGVNIVPGQCDVSWEIRPAAEADMGELRRSGEELVVRAAAHGPVPRTRETITIPPLRPLPKNPAIELARRLGAPPSLSDIPFGTEAGFFQAAGIPAVVCGPGAIDQAHRADEWLAVAQLEQACRFLERLAQWARADPERRQGAHNAV